MSYNIKNTEDLEVHKSETDTGEDEDDEESYLNSLETEDISSALGPGAPPPTVTETKRRSVSCSTILCFEKMMQIRIVMANCKLRAIYHGSSNSRTMVIAYAFLYGEVMYYTIRSTDEVLW